METKKKGAKVLVVDDDENIRELMTYMLEKRGFISDSAKDGKEALEKITQEKPDIIILDVALPQMDGYEVCRQLRENPALEDIPIIFLSAQKRRDELIEGMPGAPIEYLEKPCAFDYLLKHINAFLAKKTP